MNKIVGVKYQDRFDPTEFRGREYNYFSAITLEVGDIVIATTSNGDRLAKVVSLDVPESKVDERIVPLLKTIERRHLPNENHEGGESPCQTQP